MNHLISLLHEGGFSCVIANQGETRTFTQRGVADLYTLYNNDPAFMQGAVIADKVVGKGAAALMILGGMAEVYTDVRSIKKCPTSSTASRPDIARWKRRAEKKPTCNGSTGLSLTS